MENEAEIEKIANQEQKVTNLKTYLIISFFLISIIVIIIFFSSLFGHLHDQMSATKILIMFIVYVVLLVVGYFCNKALSKKLDKLWDQKKSFF